MTGRHSVTVRGCARGRGSAPCAHTTPHLRYFRPHKTQKKRCAQTDDRAGPRATRHTPPRGLYKCIDHRFQTKKRGVGVLKCSLARGLVHFSLGRVPGPARRVPQRGGRGRGAGGAGSSSHSRPALGPRPGHYAQALIGHTALGRGCARRTCEGRGPGVNICPVYLARSRTSQPPHVISVRTRALSSYFIHIGWRATVCTRLCLRPCYLPPR